MKEMATMAENNEHDQHDKDSKRNADNMEQEQPKRKLFETIIIDIDEKERRGIGFTDKDTLSSFKSSKDDEYNSNYDYNNLTNDSFANNQGQYEDNRDNNGDSDGKRSCSKIVKFITGILVIVIVIIGSVLVLLLALGVFD